MPLTITELTIAQTWDGKALPPDEIARVRLRVSPRGLHVGVDAPFHRDPPPPGSPGPLEGLWEHEVIELFVGGPPGEGGLPYTEIELSPWGHHLVLQLRGVRQRVASLLPIRFRASRGVARWCGAARVETALLPPRPWRINAFAIHGPAGARRFLAAAALPGPEPDFHQPSRFPPFTG